VNSVLLIRRLADESAAEVVNRQSLTALAILCGIVLHVVLQYAFGVSVSLSAVPLLIVLAIGGAPLVLRLVTRTLAGQFGTDYLALVSIVAAVWLHEYLSGAIVVLMLAGGEALEQFAAGRASSALRALAKRVPTVAHRRSGDRFEDVRVEDVQVGDELSVLPHEVCPIDAQVVQGHSTMDESYLTGEPFSISKGPGSAVLSGAVNGDGSIVIRATRLAADSRHAQIMRVMQDAEQRRPRLRRLGDQLGAWYTPLALSVGVSAWWLSGDPVRFLSVVLIATPCPLLIAIPVAIVGAISTAARRGIIVKDPAALEQLDLCTTMILDKTGTLTYGRPTLVDEIYAPPFARDRVLPLVAALERHSRHPLAGPIVDAATKARCAIPEALWVREEPGAGLRGQVAGHAVLVTSRSALRRRRVSVPSSEGAGGLECVVLVDDQLAATSQFMDTPRTESKRFVQHLGPRHGFTRVLLVSGDREIEVKRLAGLVAITDVYAGATPEQKVAIVARETERARTLFVGDGINDAPALVRATVGIAFGRHSDVTAEAAQIVIVDSSLATVDGLMHLSRRLRRIALQSAVGGMLLSGVGVGFAAAGLLFPVAGALLQELIDVFAVLNALRTAREPRLQSDFVSTM
jgi:heavy metal translocating P-type ATPase